MVWPIGSQGFCMGLARDLSLFISCVVAPGNQIMAIVNHFVMSHTLHWTHHTVTSALRNLSYKGYHVTTEKKIVFEMGTAFQIPNIGKQR